MYDCSAAKERMSLGLNERLGKLKPRCGGWDCKAKRHIRTQRDEEGLQSHVAPLPTPDASGCAVALHANIIRKVGTVVRLPKLSLGSL